MALFSLLPLMLIPFILYNLIAFGFVGTSGLTPFDAQRHPAEPTLALKLTTQGRQPASFCYTLLP